ncbi:adenylate kinase isoenzyme 5 [Chironomus tepperi]|uniref:adenylate kinase isoenzyme 5 n=1 Tax=Chironomus tepperi TaxID=113505 RepID=UPI00391FAF86
MGICMDTEAKSQQEVQDMDEDRIQEWKGGGGRLDESQIITQSPKSEKFVPQMANVGKVKFQPPNVPVIFVLGGPGSGKVTHCDTLMQEKRGLTHINMMDLLQQYAMGNDMQDFSKLPSKTVTEVLMLEMKMSPAAKAYLISGYPRSMRDVVEYTEKIQVLNGVILISWRQSVLKKQIDFGAKLGHVVLSLAKMELENFFKSVMPVADYFDQSDMLVAINGERAPSEVYKDFRAAVLDILQANENQEAVLNGVAGIGHGNDEIPGSIVSVETAPKQEPIRVREAMMVTTPPNAIESPVRVKTKMNGMVGKNVIEVETIENHFDSVYRIPPIIFVIGGPGSNKTMLCLKAVGMNAGWGHFSTGRTIRTIAESDPKPLTENFAIKEALMAGEMVSKESMDKLIHTNILQLINKKGIIIDGYPRDLNQLYDFEERYDQKPPIIMVDTSKLQLGRSRLDDSVSAFRRRLEIFRLQTIPMLQALDMAGRLNIIYGDPGMASVQREFERVIRQFIDIVSGNDVPPMNGDAQPRIISGLYNRNSHTDPKRMSKQRMNGMNHENLHDSMPGVIPTISNHVSNYVNNHQNGYVTNGHLGANKSYTHPRTNTNGTIPNGRRPNLRSMLQDAEMDSHM